MSNYIENSNKYYDLTTGAYISHFGEHLHLFIWPKHLSRKKGIELTNRIYLSDGKLNPQSEVIDLGCGIGSLALLLKKKIGCNVTGININENQLKIAKKKSIKKEVDFYLMDIMKLKLNKKFDTAFLIGVDPHLPNKQKALKKIKMHLKKKGRIVMTAWLQGEKINYAQREFLINPLCKLGGFAYLETFDGYKKIFAKEKFKIIKFKDITTKVKRSVDEFYYYALELSKKCNSFKEILKISKITPIFKMLKRGDIKKQLEDAFLGPIYLKMCIDAGIFKLGYFVLEK